VDEILSEYLGVVVESGLETTAAEVLSAAVTAGRLGEIDAILLPSLNGDDPMPGALRDAFRSAGWVADLTTTGESPFVPLPATWETYLEKLPSRRRHKVRRAEADLLAWSGQPLRLRVVQSEADLSEGRAILERLHEGRWRTAGQRGVFGSQRFTAFHDIVLPVLLANGALEMAWLEARGEPVAAQYNIVWGTKVYFYQGGRRTDIPRHLRPGFALHAIAIRRAIELGRSEYDFLGGPSAYKLDLALATRSLTTLHARRPGLRLAACRALDRVTGIVRRLRRREGRPANSAPLPAAGPIG
jgi:CelD/BcsL family acetyltransferase involved in cellulose biosynthesis